MSVTSILVANRGEIACRVLRTAKSLGHHTIAVYSQADRAALHVELADEAIAIGPAPAAQSYLDSQRIVQAACAAGASAIHPGYGFLSENADFARACAAAGIIFIGPGADAIDLMGNKAAAKRRMIAAGVACLPGYEGDDQSAAALTAAAMELGFPVMIKATAGGGGRGMRLVLTASEFDNALQLARSEALAAFGCDDVILERALLRPRHVEIQVLADAHGHVVHLGERDCSMQRRHQKIIEEAPCPGMDTALRARMGAAAVDAARSINYRGAGTVEFLLSEDGEFYFMEMNTRLQVEHPVTEMITGVDLVAQQIRIADGRPLDMSQDDITLRGHAIEARLYAEDPANDFLPATGHLDWLQFGAGNGVRVDAGVRSGDDISPYYDPMLAKIIAAGSTRQQALDRLRRALANTAVFGVPSNRDFLLDALGQDTFARGAATTAFIADHYPDGRFTAHDDELAVLSAVLQHLLLADEALALSVAVSATQRNWSSTGKLISHYQYAQPDGGNVHIRLTTLGPNDYRVQVNDKTHKIAVIERHVNDALVAIDGHARRVIFHAPHARRIGIATDRATASNDNALGLPQAALPGAASGKLLAPMHGVIVELTVAPGDRVSKGQRVAILEAMKMQHELLADMDGTVTTVHTQPGQQVAGAAPVVDIAPPEHAADVPGDATRLPQADDFLAESAALYQLLAPLDDAGLARPTLFNGWTGNDILTHLHVWNQAAELALHDEPALMSFLAKVRVAMQVGDLRGYERQCVDGITGVALREQWHAFCVSMAHRFAQADPKARVKWAGPDMSVRSSITARLMETWAHGQALYDLLGVERRDEDRIRNIAILGVNTFAWTFKNRGMEPPGPPPCIVLTAPSGAIWRWHEENDNDRISGLATEFCQVVTQVRNVADTSLAVRGPVASAWMANAQCFAGPPHAPPAPGARYRATR